MSDHHQFHLQQQHDQMHQQPYDQIHQQMQHQPFPLNPMFPASHHPMPTSSSTGETPRKAYRPPALRTQGHLPTRSLEELSDASGDEGDVGSGLGSGFSAGYRRARAGTLPSTLDAPFAGDRYGLSNAVTPTAPTHQRDLSLGHPELITRSGGTTPIEPLERQRQFPYARPGLRHSNSSAAALTGSGSLSLGGQQESLQGAPGLLDDGFPSDAQGRLRSGSLTRPDKAVGTVSDAFGSGFSNTWLQNPAGRSSMNQVTTARPGALGRGAPLHQVTSRESSFSSGNSSGGGEDNYAISQSTVDYLGLADNMETPRAATFGFQSGPAPPVPNNPSMARGPGAGSAQDLQMTPTAATMVARNRASTVSVQPKSSASFQDLISAANLGLDRDPTRPVGLFDSAQRNSAANLRAGIEGMEYLENGGINNGNRDPYGPSASHFGMPGSGQQLRGYKDDGLSGMARPRATTISMLDQPSARLGNVGMHGSELMDSLIAPSAPTPPPMGMSSGLISANQGGRRSALGNEDGGAGSRRRERGGDGARSGPGGASGDGMAAGQTPTRSIWLGNLDVMTTAQDLLQVFQGYGDIESLRLLPEKSCAFVNFIDRNDAIRAKEDVQLRMHNLIPTLSDTPIRIGFGKIDSVPTAQPSASTQQYSLSNSSASSMASQSDVESDAESDAGDALDSVRLDEISSPTRALWVGSIPSHITSTTLANIFSAFGSIESVRTLTSKQCGFVNFESLESASSARDALNGREFLGRDIGPIRVGYARAPASDQRGNEGSPSTNNFASSFSGQKADETSTGRPAGTAPMTQENVSHIESYGNDLVRDLINKGSPRPSGGPVQPSPSSPQHPEADVAAEGDVNEQQMLMTVLSHGDANLAADVQAVGKHSEKSALYYSYIPVVPDRSHYRKFDTVALKDIRRRLDGGYCAPEEVDQIAQDLMDDCVVLSSDYIGNTIIQKLYASTTTSIRMEMLRRIAPHLALTGTHKNGTWAAQKIIECAQSEEEMLIISRNLSPYVPPLSADSYGNYLVSACLKFPSPFNGFVYDAMVDRTWDIAQTRFGARCMRTCLESSHTSFFQKKRLASAIILHSIPLATNPNGALLLTWLMDANELPGRYGLLATRLASFVQHLATHKLASLTILRLVNQKNEPEAAKTMLDAIFRSANDQTLREILQDQVHGVHAISKIVCSDAIIRPDERPEILAAVKRVLEDMRSVSGLNYKRLLEECGLPVPAAPSGGNRYQGGGRREGGHRHREQNHNGGYNPNNGPGYRGRGYNQNSNNAGNSAQQMGGFDSYGMMPDINQMMSSMQAFQLGQGMTGSLSPLLANQHSFGQVMNPSLPPLSPTPTLGSFATPHAQLMSPNSDPFNPFASPSQLPRNPNGPVRYPTPIRRSPAPFDLSPTLGGLGMQPASREDMHRSSFPGFAPT